jgi:hypothetical protein
VPVAARRPGYWSRGELGPAPCQSQRKISDSTNSLESRAPRPRLGANLNTPRRKAACRACPFIARKAGLLAKQKAAQTPTAQQLTRTTPRGPRGPGRPGPTEPDSELEVDRPAGLELAGVGLQPKPGPEARPGHWATQGASWGPSLPESDGDTRGPLSGSGLRLPELAEYRRRGSMPCHQWKRA